MKSNLLKAFVPAMALAMFLGTSVVHAEEAETVNTAATAPVTVKTDDGWMMGAEIDGVYTFKGIPYAKAERFQMPEDPDSWDGLRICSVYGESCPNGSTIVSAADFLTPSGTDNVSNEDCQYLNVWTTSMDTEAKKPVIFWLHGGGWQNGSASELAYYEGENLSRSQDVVFVSINHRLNVLGFTDLSAYGEEYQYSGNVGVADMVKALEWVQDNIALFGGDPDNVTIVGQSGGGGKVGLLCALPAAEGLFQKGVICSGGGWNGLSQDETQAAGVALVEKTKETYGLETDEEALEKLKTISYDELKSLSSGTGVGQGPVVDGDYYPQPLVGEDGRMAESANDIPLIVTTTYAETMLNLSFLSVTQAAGSVTQGMENPDDFLAAYSQTYATEEGVRSQLEAKYGDKTDALLELFHEAYPGHTDFDLLWLNTGSLYESAKEIVNARVEAGGAPLYRGVWSYEFPIFGGCPAWHTGGDLPFLFANTDKIDYLIAGDEEAAQALSDLAATALCNFARTGDPSQEGLEWESYTADNKAEMVFDHNTELRVDFDTELRELIGYDDGWGSKADAQHGK